MISRQGQGDKGRVICPHQMLSDEAIKELQEIHINWLKANSEEDCSNPIAAGAGDKG